MCAGMRRACRVQFGVKGDLADATFSLTHPAPLLSIREALEDASRRGMARGIRLRDPSRVRGLDPFGVELKGS